MGKYLITYKKFYGKKEITFMEKNNHTIEEYI